MVEKSMKKHDNVQEKTDRFTRRKPRLARKTVESATPLRRRRLTEGEGTLEKKG